MKWNNLRENKCPECNGDFTKGLKLTNAKSGDEMFEHKCGFKITQKKYRKIVSGMVVDDLKGGDSNEY